MSDERTPQTVKSYAGGIHARNAQRAEERKNNPTLPNLGAAAVTYKPGDNPQTIAQMGADQRDAESEGGSQPGLSPETIKGMTMLADAQREAQAKQPPRPKPAVDKPADDDATPEELEFLRALEGAKEDAIQNERERKAVADRCGEIDLAQGLLTGEFTQKVPVVPGKLDVVFRCLTTGENTELRLYMFDLVQEDPRRARVANDLLAFYQTVATVLRLNNNEFVPHMVPSGPFGRLAFNKEIFEKKAAEFMAYPLPLISALGTHSGWFEMRVRDLFATTDRLKNG